MRDAADGGGINGHKYRPRMENSHPPYSRGRFCTATAGTGGAGLRAPNPGFWRSEVDPTPTHGILSAKRPFPLAKRRDETIFPPYVVVLKQSRDVVAARIMGGRVMSIIKNDRAESESWDPALWSIGTVLGVAIVYLACLT
jgi:hypothetical protein